MIGKRVYILLLIMIIVYSFDERFGWLLCIMLPAYGIYQLYKLHTDYIKVEAVCITVNVWKAHSFRGRMDSTFIL